MMAVWSLIQSCRTQELFGKGKEGGGKNKMFGYKTHIQRQEEIFLNWKTLKTTLLVDYMLNCKNVRKSVIAHVQTWRETEAATRETKCCERK